MGTSGNSKKWQFAVGDDECSAPEVLSEQFGIEFDFVTDDTYSDTSDCVHCSDYGNIIIPVKNKSIKGDCISLVRCTAIQGYMCMSTTKTQSVRLSEVLRVQASAKCAG